jgi:hypothetical protein
VRVCARTVQFTFNIVRSVLPRNRLSLVYAHVIAYHQPFPCSTPLPSQLLQTRDLAYSLRDNSAGAFDRLIPVLHRTAVSLNALKTNAYPDALMCTFLQFIHLAETNHPALPVLKRTMFAWNEEMDEAGLSTLSSTLQGDPSHNDYDIVRERYRSQGAHATLSQTSMNRLGAQTKYKMHETTDSQCPSEVDRFSEGLASLARYVILNRRAPAFVPITKDAFRARRALAVPYVHEIPNPTLPDPKKSSNDPITRDRVERHATLVTIDTAKAYFPNGWGPDITRHIDLIRRRYADNNDNPQMQLWLAMTPADRLRCLADGTVPP